MVATSPEDAARAHTGPEFARVPPRRAHGGDLPAPAAVRRAMRELLEEVGEGLLTRRQLDAALARAGVREPMAGDAVAQTLALLACHAHECVLAAKEIAAGRGTSYLRACLIEGLRLWPPVRHLTRVVDVPVDWHGVRLEPGTTVLVPVELLGGGREFAPEEWIGSGPTPLDGCPGAEDALEVGQAALAELLRERGYELLDADLGPGRPLPARLDSRRLRFAVHRVGRAVVRHAVPAGAVPRQRVDDSAHAAARPAS
ncbi:hypothetical protein [Thermoactinospora rubra]|uniref:hypothetical protein n=1 Tax=Thermoactinospora rubra TaxID=1088767 RepID=UPI000A0FE959|nr:hypothetical protein [Thermoactinospora rubra]